MVVYEVGDRVRVKDNEGRNTLGTVVGVGKPITSDGIPWLYDVELYATYARTIVVRYGTELSKGW